jgi:hypothetical protein
MVMQTMLLHKERPQLKHVGAVVPFSLVGKLGKLFPVFRFENRNPTNRRDTDSKPMVSWAELLDEAVRIPGYIHEAYTLFPATF